MLHHLVAGFVQTRKVGIALLLPAGRRTAALHRGGGSNFCASNERKGTEALADKTRVQLQVMRQLGTLRTLGYPVFTIAPIRDPHDPLTPSTVMLYHYTLESGADYIRVHYPEYIREIQELSGWWS